ncbi:MAG: hypothetical protein Q9M36_06795 [Sulfurovum sp.]|nr:hypothetical protein [Sulfurovum sp.]
MGDFDIESEEEFNTRKQLDFKNWCKNHPMGVYYMVRCLDGGAWDRSTRLGDFEDLGEAANIL